MFLVAVLLSATVAACTVPTRDDPLTLPASASVEPAPALEPVADSVGTPIRIGGFGEGAAIDTMKAQELHEDAEPASGPPAAPGADPAEFPRPPIERDELRRRLRALMGGSDVKVVEATECARESVDSFRYDPELKRVTRMSPILKQLVGFVCAQDLDGFEVTSGIRTTDENERLRREYLAGRHPFLVAEHSRHIEGLAIDVKADDQAALIDVIERYEQRERVLVTPYPGAHVHVQVVAEGAS